MLERWGGTVARRRWLIVVLSAVLVAIGGAWGTGVFGSLTNGGFADPGSESYRAAERIEQTVGRQGADVIALYTGENVTLDDPAVRAAVEGTLSALPDGAVVRASTYWNVPSPANAAFASADRHATYAAIQLAGETATDRMQTFRDIEDRLRETGHPGLDVSLGGSAAINSGINDQVAEDLARAETLSMPILLVLLVIVFGSIVAAGLPLGVGVVAVLGSFAVLRLMTSVTEVSVFAINIVTLLGLGLAIDYALFVVNRFREEIRRREGGAPVPVATALARTMATAGRTVVFSGVTVAISLAGLAIFPQTFLRSMAYGGVAAVLVAMVTAVTLLPAVLAILGPRVDALSVGRLARRRRAVAADPGRPGGWERLARSVMRRPVIYIVGVGVVLLALATPFLRVEFGGIDERALPEDAEARTTTEFLGARFPAAASQPIDVLVEAPTPAAAQQVRDGIAGLAAADAVDVAASRGDATLLSVSHTGAPLEDRALDLVTEIRDLDLPAGTTALVGGVGAEQVDLRGSLADRLPWTAGIVILATTLLLFAAFGSLVLPIKAIVMNLLSMTASFGVVVWIFQDGHLADLLAFTPTGSIETTQPILMLAILFGLSMDYEVFLLSRIRERYDTTRDATDAVAVGLQRTGRIITSAALLLVVVIGAFSTSGVTFIKMIGVGMAVAIVVDATIVRALLVPATMRLLGDAAWWAPAPLRRWYDRYGIGERDEPDAARPAPVLDPVR